MDNINVNVARPSQLCIEPGHPFVLLTLGNIRFAILMHEFLAFVKNI